MDNICKINVIKNDYSKIELIFNNRIEIFDNNFDSNIFKGYFHGDRILFINNKIEKLISRDNIDNIIGKIDLYSKYIYCCNKKIL